MGMSDGVNKVWLLRFRGALDIEGFPSDRELTAALLSRGIDWSKPANRLKEIAQLCDEALTDVQRQIEEEVRREQIAFEDAQDEGGEVPDGADF